MVLGCSRWVGVLIWRLGDADGRKMCGGKKVSGYGQQALMKV